VEMVVVAQLSLLLGRTVVLAVPERASKSQPLRTNRLLSSYLLQSVLTHLRGLARLTVQTWEQVMVLVMGAQKHHVWVRMVVLRKLEIHALVLRLIMALRVSAMGKTICLPDTMLVLERTEETVLRAGHFVRMEALRMMVRVMSVM